MQSIFTLIANLIQSTAGVFAHLVSMTPDLRRRRPFHGVKTELRDLKRLRHLNDPCDAACEDALSPHALPQNNRHTYEHRLSISFQSEMDRLKREAERCMRQIQIQIDRVAAAPSFHEDDIVASFRSRLNAVFRDWQSRLVEARLGALRNKRALNVFRRKNNIVRDARAPKIALAVLGVIAVAVIESLFNYHFLVLTGALSPIETLAFVAAAATINVALGNLTGFWGVRNLGHIRFHRKFLGFLVVLLGVPLALGLHYALATYRHAIDTVLSDPAVQDDPSLLLKRFGEVRSDFFAGLVARSLAFTGDLNAIIVFAIGVLFNLLSIWEGAVFWSDTYPGLWQHERNYRRASAAAQEMLDSFRAELEGVLSEALQSLEEVAQSGQRRLQAVKLGINDAVLLGGQFEQEATKLENALVRMIADYRHEYRQAREVSGPRYWQDDVPRLDRESTYVIDSYIQVHERETQDFNALDGAIDVAKTRLAQEQADALARVDDYLNDIEQDAAQEDAQASVDIEGNGRATR